MKVNSMEESQRLLLWNVQSNWEAIINRRVWTGDISQSTGRGLFRKKNQCFS